jgi:hypothetical protein
LPGQGSRREKAGATTGKLNQATRRACAGHRVVFDDDAGFADDKSPVPPRPTPVAVRLNRKALKCQTVTRPCFSIWPQKIVEVFRHDPRVTELIDPAVVVDAYDQECDARL